MKHQLNQQHEKLKEDQRRISAWSARLAEGGQKTFGHTNFYTTLCGYCGTRSPAEFQAKVCGCRWVK